MQLSSFCVSRYGACASVLARSLYTEYIITATSFISSPTIYLDRSLSTLEPCISLSHDLSFFEKCDDLFSSRTNLFASLLFYN